MVIERSPLNIIPGSDEDIELEIMQQPVQNGADTEVFMQPDGSAVLGRSKCRAGVEFGENLAETLDERELNTIASELTAQYQEDLDSRDDWFETFSKGLDLLGINIQDRSEPFVGASGVHHPILAEAVTQFQAQAYKELLPPGGPVNTEVLGITSDDKVEKANRVKNFMNYQITYKMEEYDPEMDQLLFYLPLSGSAFKKFSTIPVLDVLLPVLSSQKT